MKAERLEARKQRDALRLATWERDGGRCRVCRIRVRLNGNSLMECMHRHHIVYRSAGGPDDLSNLVWICGQCSSDEHDTKKISITGTASDLRVEPRR